MLTGACPHLRKSQTTDAERVAALWQLCDYVVYQDDEMDDWRLPTAAEAIELASGRKWRLLGPPAAQRPSGEAPVCGAQYAPAEFPSDCR